MTPEPIVDLRSDTVTRPTAAMRRAMAEAEVGDDVLGDDPTIHELERRVAALTAREAAVFVPSGTMGNEIAIFAHVRPGETVVLERESHVFLYEQGGLAAISHALAHVVTGERGAIAPETLLGTLRDEDDHASRVTLVCAENTHNRAGGVIVPLGSLQALKRTAHAHGLRLHLDGARLWNASVASGVPLAEWAATADSVMMCFSKGLGAPVGSIVVGDGGFIHRARRARKLLGGGMRQAGVLAAACLHALDHHLVRLTDDHTRARRLAAGFRVAPGVRVDEPDTNIVIVTVVDPALDPDALVGELERRGVRMMRFGGRRLRAIVHLDLDDAAIARAIARFGEAVAAVAAGGPEAAATAPARR